MSHGDGGEEKIHASPLSVFRTDLMIDADVNHVHKSKLLEIHTWHTALPR